MSLVDLLGITAALCTSLAFLPQALKTIKTQHAKDISLGMYVVFTIGVSLWFAYGLILVNWPIILANALTLVTAGIILGLKIKNG